MEVISLMKIIWLNLPPSVNGDVIMTKQSTPHFSFQHCDCHLQRYVLGLFMVPVLNKSGMLVHNSSNNTDMNPCNGTQ